jgi:hypothetical protein
LTAAVRYFLSLLLLMVCHDESIASNTHNRVIYGRHYNNLQGKNPKVSVGGENFNNDFLYVRQQKPKQLLERLY